MDGVGAEFGRAEMSHDQKTRARGVTTARWSNSEVALIVTLTARGVRSIVREDDIDRGQGSLWPVVRPRYPDLAAIGPFGRRLGQELENALSGRPLMREVPWDPDGPFWHQALYGYICRLRTGHYSLMPDRLFLAGDYRDKRALRAASCGCALIPLVAVHRVWWPDESSSHPWGDVWRERLIAAERSHHAAKS